MTTLVHTFKPAKLACLRARWTRQQIARTHPTGRYSHLRARNRTEAGSRLQKAPKVPKREITAAAAAVATATTSEPSFGLVAARNWHQNNEWSPVWPGKQHRRTLPHRGLGLGEDAARFDQAFVTSESAAG